ncbi:uncharacterized protein H6S33_001447 [Morchella sextelata]|uniref:uncharacterized protein n=1 Tax=Morchella sextelata TaxID=1174677 RepID=UPI001D043263|nr:uncharacterized protein H6S33_001447 [Morchella sextelata]KAH0609219.1 hypothetical protein H6S33_001447 [Morchella sextelata]
MAQHVDHYFNVTNQSRWNVEGFFRYPDNAKVLEEHDRDYLMNTWVQGLRSVANDDGRCLSDREAAKKQLNKFKPPRPPPPPPLEPPLYIQGNHKVSFNNNSIGAPPEPLARPPKRRHPSAIRNTKKTEDTPPSGYLLDFKRAWKNMDSSKKWRLPADDFTEADFECFKPSQWRIISALIQALPVADAWFLDSITAYRDERLDGPDRLVAHIHDTPLFAPGERDRLIADEREGNIWLRDSMRAWCELLSRSSFNRNHQESWYISKLWEPIYNQCMETIPGSYMSRGESKSQGTCDRRDSYDIHRKKRKHGKKFSSTSDRKWVHDTLKVVKVLHDMLYRLQPSSGVVGSKGTGVLQVLGIVTAGRHCQNWRMSHAKGSICLLVGDQVREIPNNFENTTQYFKLLTFLWRLRCVLKSGKETCKLIGGKLVSNQVLFTGAEHRLNSLSCITVCEKQEPACCVTTKIVEEA